MSRSSKPGASSESKDDGKDADVPKDVQIVHKALEVMGIDEYEPSIVPQLLEYVYREIDQSLSAARDYASFAGRPDAIQPNDVQMVADTRAESERERIRWSAESREVTMSLASQVNRIPLEPIPDEVGVLLPPRDQDKLLGWNFEIKYATEKAGAGGAASPKRTQSGSSSRADSGRQSSDA